MNKGNQSSCERLVANGCFKQQIAEKVKEYKAFEEANGVVAEAAAAAEPALGLAAACRRCPERREGGQGTRRTKWKAVT